MCKPVLKAILINMGILRILLVSYLVAQSRVGSVASPVPTAITKDLRPGSL